MVAETLEIEPINRTAFILLKTYMNLPLWSLPKTREKFVERRQVKMLVPKGYMLDEILLGEKKIWILATKK